MYDPLHQIRMPNLPHTFRFAIAAVASIILFLGIGGCSPPEPDNPSVPMGVLGPSIDAHGGLDRWSSFGTLEYDFAKGDTREHHLIDLHSRKLLLTGEGYTIGFDGQEVWVMPDLDAYSGRPRFYSSLNFYFFGIPFVLADPGAIHESLGRTVVGDETYDLVKTSFEPGVGDSPDDYYLTYLDTTSHHVELLLYTVTFRSREPNENYGARTYEWEEVDGLLVPSKMSSYRWNAEASTLGEHRSDAFFTNVTFRTERPDEALFAMPDGAEIDSMPEVSDQ